MEYAKVFLFKGIVTLIQIKLLIGLLNFCKKDFKGHEGLKINSLPDLTPNKASGPARDE